MKLLLLAVFLAPAICLADQHTGSQMEMQTGTLQAFVVDAVGFGFEKNGEQVGIGVDIFRALNRVVDFDLEPVVATASTINDKIHSGEFDLALMYKRELPASKAIPIAPVVSVSYIQIGTKSYPTIESLAHAKAGYIDAESLSPELREILRTPRYYEDIVRGFEALEHGEIDVLIGTRSKMSSGVRSINTLETDGMVSRSFVSTEIYVYSRTGLLTEEQIVQLRGAIEDLRESNMIQQIRRYYMSQSAKQ